MTNAVERAPWARELEAARCPEALRSPRAVLNLLRAHPRSSPSWSRASPLRSSERIGVVSGQQTKLLDSDAGSGSGGRSFGVGRRSRRLSRGPQGLEALTSFADAPLGVSTWRGSVWKGPGAWKRARGVSRRSSDRRGAPEACGRVPRGSGDPHRSRVAVFGSWRAVSVNVVGLSRRRDAVSRRPRFSAPRSAVASRQLEAELLGARSRVRGRRSFPRRRCAVSRSCAEAIFGWPERAGSSRLDSSEPS